MNKKGFAVSGIIYSILVLFLILVLGLLSLNGGRKLVLDRLKNDALSYVNKEPLAGNIEVIDLKVASKTNGASELNSSFRDDKLAIEINLPSNATIEYEVNIYNANLTEQVISSLDIVKDNANIDVSLDSNRLLKANSSTKFTIIFKNTSGSAQTCSIVLTYVFGPSSYTIAFDANGGNIAQTTKTVNYGEAYGYLPTPTKEGYIFKGWHSGNLFDKDDFPDMSDKYIDGAGELVAHGEYNVYKVYVKPNTTYTITNSGQSFRPGYVIYDKNDNYVIGENYNNRTHVTFTTPNNASYIKFSVVSLSSSYRYDKEIFKIEEGSTFVKYEPYYITEDTLVSQYETHTLVAMWAPIVDVRQETINGKNYIAMDTYDKYSPIKEVKTASGVVIPRNEKELKIYVNGYETSTTADPNDYAKILTDAGYTNFTISNITYPSLSDLLAEGYNVFIESEHVWSASAKINNYFNGGINVISIGNDTTTLSLIESYAHSNSGENNGTFTVKVSNNMIKKLGDILGAGTSNDSRNNIKFIDGVEVLCEESTPNGTYDAVGYYAANGAKWIHSQYAMSASGLKQYIAGALNYMSNKGLYYYEVPATGTYKFVVTDTFDNVANISYTVQ